MLYLPCMRLRHCTITTATSCNRVLSALSRISRKFGSTIDELEILLFVILAHLVEHFPEPINNFFGVTLYKKR